MHMPFCLQAEEEETLCADLTEMLGKDEAARLLAVAHRPLAGLLDLSLIVKHVRIHMSRFTAEAFSPPMLLWITD
jgi:hypothetical protein